MSDTISRGAAIRTNKKTPYIIAIMGGFFSHRHGYGRQREITIREDAPEGLRMGLVQIGRDLGLSYGNLREVICRVLRRRPNENNWSEEPNIRDEVNVLISECEWYRVYDISEALYRYLTMRRREAEFSERLNGLFEEDGIGWQMADGQIATRGDAEFEHSVARAVEHLGNAHLQTAKRELQEALRDLSRRPEPDVTGTIQHCMAALETTARVLTNSPAATLGEILTRRRAELGIPRPLDVALERMWGYASEMGRHLQEGRNPGREQAQLLLGTASAVITYLLDQG